MPPRRSENQVRLLLDLWQFRDPRSDFLITSNSECPLFKTWRLLGFTGEGTILVGDIGEKVHPHILAVGLSTQGVTTTGKSKAVISKTPPIDAGSAGGSSENTPGRPTTPKPLIDHLPDGLQNVGMKQRTRLAEVNDGFKKASLRDLVGSPEDV